MNRRRVVPYACVAVAVALANLPALVHLVTVDPINLDSGLASSLAPWLHGQPTIDGNAGFLMQALGHRDDEGRGRLPQDRVLLQQVSLHARSQSLTQLLDVLITRPFFKQVTQPAAYDLAVAR